jgi:hypothetical protein
LNAHRHRLKEPKHNNTHVLGKFVGVAGVNDERVTDQATIACAKRVLHLLLTASYKHRVALRKERLDVVQAFLAIKALIDDIERVAVLAHFGGAKQDGVAHFRHDGVACFKLHTIGVRIVKRGVRQAGVRPLRAAETSSHVVHQAAQVLLLSLNACF